jgi:hypothetical protein
MRNFITEADEKSDECSIDLIGGFLLTLEKKS